MTGEIARAKINLALHVTGRRDDGYHLLDTLVAFADVGDALTVLPGDGLELTIDGPFAAGLSTSQNLVLDAAHALRAATGAELGAKITLTKNLPVASGIGGGSADAAAALRALNTLWNTGLGKDALAEIGAPLGADVPMCVLSVPLRATGIGTDLVPLPFSARHAILVNPGVEVSTPAIFTALTNRDNPPIGTPVDIGDLPRLRNDLEATASALEPAIGTVLKAIGATGDCRLARMSGSGATCFGLYDSREAAMAAADQLRANQTDWWVVATTLEGV